MKIAKNLADLRARAGLTQLQLAEMINYSDKAVSKWERGEGIPDIRVLIKLSEIYGISLDDIVKGGEVEPTIEPKKRISGKRIFITVLSAVLVWFIATGLFVAFYFIPQTAKYAYLVFVVAPLPMFIVLDVFSVKWGNWITNIIASSGILLSCALIFHIFVMSFSDFRKIYWIYLAAAVFEVLIILWFCYRRYASKKTK